MKTFVQTEGRFILKQLRNHHKNWQELSEQSIQNFKQRNTPNMAQSIIGHIQVKLVLNRLIV